MDATINKACVFICLSVKNACEYDWEMLQLTHSTARESHITLTATQQQLQTNQPAQLLQNLKRHEVQYCLRFVLVVFPDHTHYFYKARTKHKTHTHNECNNKNEK